MSRSIGDRIANRIGVTWKPTINSITIEQSSILLIATDGLWEVLSNEEAIKIV